MENEQNNLINKSLDQTQLTETVVEPELQKKSNLLNILIIILVLVIIVGGSFYFFLTKDSNRSVLTEEVTVEKTEETSVEENQTKNLINNEKIENCKSLDTTYHGDEIENCIIDLAVEENDISYCEMLNGKYGWDGESLYGTCLSELAVLNNNSSYCDMYVGRYKEVILKDCYRDVSSNIEITEKPFDGEIADKLCQLVPSVGDYYGAWGGTFHYSEEENFCKSTYVLEAEDDFRKIGYEMICDSGDQFFIVYFEKDDQGYCMDTKNTNIVKSSGVEYINGTPLCSLVDIDTDYKCSNFPGN